MILKEHKNIDGDLKYIFSCSYIYNQRHIDVLGKIAACFFLES